ncbi:MAG: phospholipase D family protein [Patescibacteria group bacterium]
MKTRVIRQATTKDCLFNVIGTWCRTGSGCNDRSIRILSAFASGAGVAALAPLFDVFLAHGNNIEIICGIDRNGTDAEAIRRLYDLQETHHSTLNVSIFNAPSKSAIFHPKLYINDRGSCIDFVIGSANMTCGGLGVNFESMILYEDAPRRSAEARNVLSIWRTYAEPYAPLSPTFLRPLTRDERKALLRRMPRKSTWEKRSTEREVSELWKPFSRVRLPHSARVQHRKPTRHSAFQGNYLVMDVLGETRKTQMQLPLPVANGFFRVQRGTEAEVNVAILSPDGLTQPIRRPLVMSGTSMRRIEVPEIKKRARNLAILFLKLKGRRQFAYCILPRESGSYRTANRLLKNHGQQEAQERRFFIGRKGDKQWAVVKGLIPR